MKGKTATIKFGPFDLEIILAEDCNYYVTAVSAMCPFGSHQNNAARDLKSLLGAGLVPIKISVQEPGQPTRSNTCIALADFERVVIELTIKGNERAIAITRAMVGLSMTQLAADAFGVKFEAADRQAWVKARMQSKETRRLFTDAAQDWYVRTYGVKPEGQYYAALTNRLYSKLFGMSAQALKSHYSVPSGKALRDYLSSDALHKVDAAECILVRWVDSGTPPEEALAKI